jgi:hypothetical protein
MVLWAQKLVGVFLDLQGASMGCSRPALMYSSRCTLLTLPVNIKANKSQILCAPLVVSIKRQGTGSRILLSDNTLQVLHSSRKHHPTVFRLGIILLPVPLCRPVLSCAQWRQPPLLCVDPSILSLDSDPMCCMIIVLQLHLLQARCFISGKDR